MGSVMTKQFQIRQSCVDSKTEMKPGLETLDVHADEEVRADLLEDEVEMEAQSEVDYSDESETESETPLLDANDSCGNWKKYWKLLFVWKVLSLAGIFAAPLALSMAEEPVESSSRFELDVEGCAGQVAGSTIMSMKANACLPCESLVSDTASKEQLGNSSSYAMGMNGCMGQVQGVTLISERGFASLLCDLELHSNALSQNVSQYEAVSTDAELHINPPSHNISHEKIKEQNEKPSIQKWSPSWPSIGVSSLLLAISVKIMAF